MANEDLHSQLYDKMFAEQEQFRGWLLTQPPEEILNNTYTYAVRQDILMRMEDSDLSDEQAAALLKLEHPLAEILGEFNKLETGYMDTLGDCAVTLANHEIEKEQEQRRELRELPVYRMPGDYARENGELEQYRASKKANVACMGVIDQAINAHYHDNIMDSKAAVKEVVEQFGFDRTLYVLANTVRLKDHDGRIDSDNKRWAQTVPVFEDTGMDKWDRNHDFCLRSHPCLIDAFVHRARNEYLLTQPLKAADIRAEALNILAQFQNFRQPNSPNRTHFMVEVTPLFMERAKSKDLDRLTAMLPFESLSLSKVEGWKGIYAMISQDEDRFQKLQTRRKPSIKAQLAEKPVHGNKPPAKAKGRDERT